MTFDLETFRSLCREEKIAWTTSSLKGLLAQLTRVPAIDARQVIAEIRKLGAEKRLKYKAALRYLLFSWPGMIDPGALVRAGDGRSPCRKTFCDYYAQVDATTDFVDLLYGASPARNLPAYRLPWGRMRLADDFNNTSNIGTGVAFGRQWNGCGFLDATPESVSELVRRGVPCADMRPNTRRLHAESLMNSRYDPARSLRVSPGRLRADAHYGLHTMRERHRKDAESHYWMHARFVNSVRRACKGGIAMVASHPCYTHVHAKVHFVLDGLGDLGKVARKEPLAAEKDGYVAITSSELAFCYRHWNDPRFALRNVVLFYINGQRVLPPWEADYRLRGGDGTEVYSNQEAWLRYTLAIELLSENKPFPRMGNTASVEDFIRH